MKTKLLLVTVSCLFILAFTLSVQQSAAQQNDWNKQVKAIQRSPVQQEVHKRFGKYIIRSEWTGMGGNGVVLGLLYEHDFRTELGFSDEQYERLQQVAEDLRSPEKNLELKKVFDEIKAIETANGPTLQNANEETKNRYFDLRKGVNEMTTSFGNAFNAYTVTNALEVTLTLEQKQKIKDVRLVAALSDESIFLPSMFEALDLTDVQKQEMEKIKKELESEFEKLLMTFQPVTRLYNIG